jgi:hypothetical protein
MKHAANNKGLLADRGDDLYETPACATRALINTGILDQFPRIFEPAAGRGAISRELTRAGWGVVAHDLVHYEGADPGIHGGIDFFGARELVWLDAIVTNPPFRHADRFIRKGLGLGVPVFVLLRLLALEGAGRSDILGHLRHVFVGIERLPMMHREGWAGPKLKVGAMPFAWFYFHPAKRSGDIFTVSRISWREEAPNERYVPLKLAGPHASGGEEVAPPG